MEEAIRRLSERLEGTLDSADARAVVDAWKAADEELDRLGQLLDLGQVTAEFVHEFRQPLVGVKAFAQMIAANPDNVETVKSHAGKVVHEANRMSALIERVERFLKQDGIALAQPVDINNTVDEAVKLLRRRLSREDIQLQVNLAQGPVVANCDAFMIEQVVVNLIANAIDALNTTGGGTIEVSTRLNNDIIELRVADDGPGIDESLSQRLFQRFASTKSHGLGLGLYLSRRNAQNCGGDLVLEKPSNQTTFLLTLPKRKGNGTS